MLAEMRADHRQPNEIASEAGCSPDEVRAALGTPEFLARLGAALARRRRAGRHRAGAGGTTTTTAPPVAREPAENPPSAENPPPAAPSTPRKELRRILGAAPAERPALAENELHEGDCLELMARLGDGSIDLVVTSPPYAVGKEYELDVSIQDYCRMMESSLAEWVRVLKPGGYAVVNFGDYFNSGNRFYDSDVPSCYPAGINYYRWGVEMAGMDLQATRVWRKQFARMGIPFVCNSHPRPVFDYEHIWAFRKKNGSAEEFVNDRKLSQRGVVGEDWGGVAGLAKHCAAFPVGLPAWAIRVYSRPGDLVLDPFAGSGTTGVACVELGRRYLLMEKRPAYCDIARDRLRAALASSAPGGA